MNKPAPKKTNGLSWRNVTIILMMTLFTRAVYVTMFSHGNHTESHEEVVKGHDSAISLGQLSPLEKSDLILNKIINHASNKNIPAGDPKSLKNDLSIRNASVPVITKHFTYSTLPVLGPVPSEGIKPLFGVTHTGRDAIFALACNYPKLFYQRFVGSLRKIGYKV